MMGNFKWFLPVLAKTQQNHIMPKWLGVAGEPNRPQHLLAGNQK
jgi:hypothetical protein